MVSSKASLTVFLVLVFVVLGLGPASHTGCGEEPAPTIWPSIGVGEKPTTRKVREELEKPTRFDVEQTPLDEVAAFLKEQHKIEIQLDTKALDDVGIGSDTPVTARVRDVSLRSALKLALRSIDPAITFIIEDEVLQITTTEVADEKLVTRIYNVNKLLPPKQTVKDFVATASAIGGGEVKSETLEIVPFQHLLIVRGTRDEQRSIGELLAAIHKALQDPDKPKE